MTKRRTLYITTFFLLTRVSRRWLDDGVPGLEVSGLLSVLYHAQADAVLHAPAGVEELALRNFWGVINVLYIFWYILVRKNEYFWNSRKHVVFEVLIHIILFSIKIKFQMLIHPSTSKYVLIHCTSQSKSRLYLGVLYNCTTFMHSPRKTAIWKYKICFLCKSYRN